MKNYDISVIIPIFNCEKYLSKAIKSLIIRGSVSLIE